METLVAFAGASVDDRNEVIVDDDCVLVGLRTDFSGCCLLDDGH